ncbi:Asp-tRNA(Asn)/Glu-tRNA(Gln) amidotransferase subunit GatA [Candidatus Uhrbacteria bacterium]|nr:Asp-tRNA(Asn)/Glu-tRNA(Gln) amidotransferase subunit GatA [Candidatus Uhrbacteria bacterium]
MKLLNQLTITEARTALDANEITSVELTKACFAEIESRNPALNAYLGIWNEEALAEAARSDERRANGEALGPLDGVPLAIKDVILVEGRTISAASKILESHVAARDATVIRKLKAQGAVFLGRTNMDEFAMGGSTENSAYGVTRNPHDPDRVPGGSSGGSAAAVAAHLCIAALGSDTGGSIRQPAAYCGLVGLKPTYGRVSRSGLMAMASSFDQIGPMTKTVEDAAILFEAMQGRDPLDQTTVSEASFQPAWRDRLDGIRIGLPKQAWGDGIHEEVRTAVLGAVETLKELGAEIVDVDLPYSEETLAVYYVVMPCEASTNLSRYDGMRYGVREPASNLLETYLESRGEHIGPEARRRILLGTYALSAGYYDAYYKKAKQVQTLIKNAYTTALSDVDVLLTPTTASQAFRLGEKVNDPLSLYVEDLFTVGANVTGLPAISVPCGPAGELPMGMHLMGRAFDEATIFAVARAYEQTVHG